MPINFNNFGINPASIQPKVIMPQPMPQAAPSQDSGMEGLGGILNGAAGLLKAFNKSNPVATANAAVDASMKQMPQQALGQSILNPQTTQLPAQQASPPIANPQQQLANKIQPTIQNLKVNPQTAATLNGIYQNESSDAKDPYTSIGKATSKGNVAIGKYQIMDFNIPSWTKEALGKPLTKDQFINDPKAQEATAAYKVNSLLNQGYSPEDAASIWFSGKPLNHADMYAKDAYGTTVKDYVQKFSNTLNNPQPVKTVSQALHTPPQNINGGDPIPKEMEQTPAFQQTMSRYSQLRQQGITKSPIVTTIDYSKPATEPRLTVVNAETGKVLLQTEVAQGKEGFSNTPGSHQSSLGSFVTTQTYDGKHGMSLRIKGLDKGVNDNVEARDVVVHGADYIGNGKTGHSFGCFAVPTKDAPKLINLIKGGTIINAYGGNNDQSNQAEQSNKQQPQSNQSPLQQIPGGLSGTPPQASSMMAGADQTRNPNPQLGVLNNLMKYYSSRQG